MTSLVASALQVVVHLRRLRDGTRVLEEIGVIDRAGDTLAVYPAWTRTAGIGPAARRLADDLAARGVAVPDLLL